MTRSSTLSDGVLDIAVPRVFAPLLANARYKGAYGGRGGGKSHFFAGRIVRKALKQPGLRVACLREIQRDLAESAKLLISDKIAAFGVSSRFRVLDNRIETPGGGLIIFRGLRDQNADSIKSLEGFDLAWVEEAHRLTQRSLALLRPTIRKPGSELWFSWNPERRADPVDELLRGPNPPDDAVSVEALWRHNPWFPAELDAERRRDERTSPSYRHVWEGDYATVVEGAYYATQLAQAQSEGRMTALSVDPMLELRAYWDLGVEDATAIWIVQFAGQRIHVLDYIEGEGQALSYYVGELRRRGYGAALAILPHDAAHRGFSDALSYEQHLKDAAFRTRIVANQGRGAAMQRVEALRRAFPRLWFDAGRCAAGLEALGAYHERRDEHRSVGLGPEHDWSSHAADAAGLIAIDYAPPKASLKPGPAPIWREAEGATDWMSA